MTFKEANKILNDEYNFGKYKNLATRDVPPIGKGMEALMQLYHEANVSNAVIEVCELYTSTEPETLGMTRGQLNYEPANRILQGMKQEKMQEVGIGKTL